MKHEQAEMNRIIGHIGNIRGATAEKMVARALRTSIWERSVPDWVRGYEVASRKDNEHGIDLWIDTDVGKIPVQVKSSFRGKRQAEARRGRKIPVVVIKVGMSNAEILDCCITSIGSQRDHYLEERGWDQWVSK